MCSVPRMLVSDEAEKRWFEPGARIYQPEISRKREMLPIFEKKREFLDTFAKNQVIIAAGKTGSGKTTQIPQYLVEAGYARNGRIGCTLPRRIAASSVAKRVSEEFGCKIGFEIGYVIRFENCTSSQTLIKYMTEGILLTECLKDPDLRSYSVIMLDDAHERTINIDILFGLVKNALKRRPDLKLIISSATIDSEKFSAYFNNAPTLKVPGRLFPVEIVYTNDVMTLHSDRTILRPVEREIIKIHRMEKAGDVLVFLPGQEDIDILHAMLTATLPTVTTFGPKPVLLKLYSILIPEEQMIVFEQTQPSTRKIIITTNVAESSVTIGGIVYVIDSGLVKMKEHNWDKDADEFGNYPISQAQATQRTGRAGRTGPGICYRLYSKADFEKMSPLTPPEVQRSDLASLVLKLKLMGVKDILEFPFMDPPSSKGVAAAIYHLIMIGAMQDDGSATELGRRISKFPLEPCLAKYLFLSAQMHCSDEVLTIVSLLGVQDVTKLFLYPPKTLRGTNWRHATFFQPEGDLFTLLHIYRSWCENSCTGEWCKNHDLSFHVLRGAQRIRKQLLFAMLRQNLPIVSCGNAFEILQRTTCAAFFYNSARFNRAIVSRTGIYVVYRRLRDGCLVRLRRSSSLIKSQPVWVVYYQLVEAKHTFMQQATVVDPEWLVDVAPDFFHFHPRNNMLLGITEKFRDLHLATRRDERKTVDAKPVAEPSSERQYHNSYTNCVY